MKPQFVQYDDINYVAKITEKFALIYSYFADDATPSCALVADISDIFPPAPLASPECDTEWDTEEATLPRPRGHTQVWITGSQYTIQKLVLLISKKIQ